MNRRERLMPAGCDEQGKHKTRQRWPGVDDPPTGPIWPAWLLLMGAGYGLFSAIAYVVFVVLPWLAEKAIS